MYSGKLFERVLKILVLPLNFLKIGAFVHQIMHFGAESFRQENFLIIF